MLAAALDLLSCPHCGGPLDPIGADQVPQPIGTVGCWAGHRFDVARHGQLSLLSGRARTDTADTAEMVAARVAFLATGHYDPIRDAVVSAVTSEGPVLDVGAGPGWYLAGAVDPVEERIGVALDSSRFAARRAARAHPRVAAVVADAWSALPVRAASIGTVLSVFAPRDPAEFARVLEPGGRVVAVTPEPDHLAELRETFGLLAVAEGKSDTLADDAVAAGLVAVTDHGQVVRYGVALTAVQAADLVRMGPTARHRSADEIAQGASTLRDPVHVTVAVTVTVLRRD